MTKQNVSSHLKQQTPAN